MSWLDAIGLILIMMKLRHWAWNSTVASRIRELEYQREGFRAVFGNGPTDPPHGGTGISQRTEAQDDADWRRQRGLPTPEQIPHVVSRGIEELHELRDEIAQLRQQERDLEKTDKELDEELARLRQLQRVDVAHVEQLKRRCEQIESGVWHLDEPAAPYFTDT